MERGGDGGALAQEVYEAVDNYYREPDSPGNYEAMKALQEKAVAKAEARFLVLAAGR